VVTAVAFKDGGCRSTLRTREWDSWRRIMEKKSWKNMESSGDAISRTLDGIMSLGCILGCIVENILGCILEAILEGILRGTGKHQGENLGGIQQGLLLGDLVKRKCNCSDCKCKQATCEAHQTFWEVRFIGTISYYRTQ
jgi:hypothetical protein